MSNPVGNYRGGVMGLDFSAFYITARSLQVELLREAKLLASGDLEKEVEAYIGVAFALYAAEISPFWTGALSSSHIVTDLGETHFVHINPDVRNPVTGDPPAEYGIEQHAMGGWRAFYDRTLSELGPEMLDKVDDDVFSTNLVLFT